MPNTTITDNPVFYPNNSDTPLHQNNGSNRNKKKLGATLLKKFASATGRISTIRLKQEDYQQQNKHNPSPSAETISLEGSSAPQDRRSRTSQRSSTSYSNEGVPSDQTSTSSSAPLSTPQDKKSSSRPFPQKIDEYFNAGEPSVKVNDYFIKQSRSIEKELKKLIDDNNQSFCVKNIGPIVFLKLMGAFLSFSMESIGSKNDKAIFSSDTVLKNIVNEIGLTPSVNLTALRDAIKSATSELPTTDGITSKYVEKTLQNLVIESTKHNKLNLAAIVTQSNHFDKKILSAALAQFITVLDSKIKTLENTETGQLKTEQLETKKPDFFKESKKCLDSIADHFQKINGSNTISSKRRNDLNKLLNNLDSIQEKHNDTHPKHDDDATSERHSVEKSLLESHLNKLSETEFDSFYKNVNNQKEQFKQIIPDNEKINGSSFDILYRSLEDEKYIRDAKILENQKKETIEKANKYITVIQHGLNELYPTLYKTYTQQHTHKDEEKKDFFHTLRTLSIQNLRQLGQKSLDVIDKNLKELAGDNKNEIPLMTAISHWWSLEHSEQTSSNHKAPLDIEKSLLFHHLKKIDGAVFDAFYENLHFSGIRNVLRHANFEGVSVEAALDYIFNVVTYEKERRYFTEPFNNILETMGSVSEKDLDSSSTYEIQGDTATNERFKDVLKSTLLLLKGEHLHQKHVADNRATYWANRYPAAVRRFLEKEHTTEKGPKLVPEYYEDETAFNHFQTRVLKNVRHDELKSDCKLILQAIYQCIKYFPTLSTAYHGDKLKNNTALAVRQNNNALTSINNQLPEYSKSFAEPSQDPDFSEWGDGKFVGSKPGILIRLWNSLASWLPYYFFRSREGSGPWRLNYLDKQVHQNTYTLAKILSFTAPTKENIAYAYEHLQESFHNIAVEHTKQQKSSSFKRNEYEEKVWADMLKLFDGATAQTINKNARQYDAKELLNISKQNSWLLRKIPILRYIRSKWRNPLISKQRMMNINKSYTDGSSSQNQYTKLWENIPKLIRQEYTRRCNLNNKDRLSSLENVITLSEPSSNKDYKKIKDGLNKIMHNERANSWSDIPFDGYNDVWDDLVKDHKEAVHSFINRLRSYAAEKNLKGSLKFDDDFYEYTKENSFRYDYCLAKLLESYEKYEQLCPNSNNSSSQESSNNPAAPVAATEQENQPKTSRLSRAKKWVVGALVKEAADKVTPRAQKT